MKKIVRASMGKRLLAIVIDILTSGIIALFIYQAVIHPIWYNHMGGEAINQTLNDIQLDSHLYTLDDNEQVVEVTSSSYPESVRYFYLESTLFSFENTEMYHETDHPTFDYYVDILYRGVEDTDTSKGTLFVFSESVDPLTEEVTVSYLPRADVTPTELALFWQNTYQVAKQHLTYAPSYFAARLAIANFIFYAMGGAFLFSSAIFVLGFSYFFGDGRSFGKYILGLGLINREGYQVSKGSVLLRYLVFSIVEMIFSFRLYFIPLFISSAIMTLDRHQSALHDRLARTVVIDWQKSFIFKSREEETLYHQARISGQPQAIRVSGGMGVKGVIYIPAEKKIEEETKPA